MNRLLFVCLGNICRSPTAEAVMKHLLDQRGLSAAFFCDSAGTVGHHVGEPADPRMIKHGRSRGYNLTSISRKFVSPHDFQNFDYILAMDQANFRDLARLDQRGEYQNKLLLMTSFCSRYKEDGVPDPYYGGADGFEYVIDLLEDACAGLLEHILQQAPR